MVTHFTFIGKALRFLLFLIESVPLSEGLMWKSASKLDMPINTIGLTAEYQNCTGMYTLPNRGSSCQGQASKSSPRGHPQSPRGEALACEGRASSPAPVLGS